jgi:hypothetical protein
MFFAPDHFQPRARCQRDDACATAIYPEAKVAEESRSISLSRDVL